MSPPHRPVTSGDVLEAARLATGFMPDDEGLTLSRLAGLVTSLPPGEGGNVIIEVGAYCGRSTLYLAHGVLAAAAAPAAVPERSVATPIVFSIDHHHGSEENQAGWDHHDTSLVDVMTGRLDTLPAWRANVESAGVEHVVVAIVGDSPTIAARWATSAGLVFIDGGHGTEPAHADYNGWAPKVALGGWLAIHDVFPDPADGGRPPYELFVRALESGAFLEQSDLCRGSLRVLRRVAPGI